MKEKIKKIIKKITRPFKRTSYINNYIYKGELLKGRTALITGGSSGIGFAIAKTFLINGSNIIITGRNKDKINKAVNDLQKEKINNDNIVLGFQFDQENIEQIEESFENIIKSVEQPIDILVNNAGIIKGEKIGKTTIKEFEECMKINVEGTYFLSQTFFNYLKKQNIKGNILNICSSSSNRPAVQPYSVSKWSIRGLTIGMAKKFINYGIVVNGIAPGPTYTTLLVKDKSKDNDISLDNNPSGRYVTPEEVANGALFLVSDMGRMVVGDIMYMTGGAGTITIDDIEY